MTSTRSDDDTPIGWREFTDRDTRENAIAADLAAADLPGAEAGF